ncbi:hypothetical protein EH196_06880 [Bacillus sp. C1-1]|nr:hypothetical protein EH196_06880 [Bacillus sp. C1-1]
MAEFTIDPETNEIDFGDYVTIEQKRYGVPNEWYLHKVISSFKSNVWVETPIDSKIKEKGHNEVKEVLNVVCCGVDETKVFRVLREDCVLIKQ